jgi:serine phosphatase RsbU (regulator of sigma subunit)
MDRSARESEPRVGGMRLRVRFALLTSLALAVVMAVAGTLLYGTTTTLVRRSQERSFVEALRLLNASAEEAGHEQVGQEAVELQGGEVMRFAVRYGPDRSQRGLLYRLAMKKDTKIDLLVPEETTIAGEKSLLGLILGILGSVVLVGALVAFLVGNQVSRPLERIVDDIRQIAHGDLRHRTRVRAGGEVALLARAVDRMASSLHEAQETELELNVRERELEVAREVREALLPQSTPALEGWSLGALQIGAPAPGGDFHDFLELPDGRVGLLVCEVSGRGVPGALVGATARSYLRVELSGGADVAQSLFRVNRELARDVRRGMWVTALYVVLEPRSGRVRVACAGHKAPLVRWCAADGKLRLVQPEGIALGFDKGPVFERTLQLVELELEPGDRLVLANTGPVRVASPEGEELGEKGFYRLLASVARQPTDKAVQHLQRSLEKHAEGTPFPSDIAIVTALFEA